MTNKIDILGGNTKPTRYNPDLAAQVARQAELEEKRLELEAKRKPQEAEKQIENSKNNAKQLPGFIYVPSLGLYISEEKYLHGKEWHETQEILHKEGRRMPTIPEFVELLKFIRSPEGVVAIRNITDVYQELFTEKDPWRAEWLDAHFRDTAVEGMIVNYHTFDDQGKITKKQEKLEEYLKKDLTPGIDLDSWLNDHTKQGLPKPSCKKGNLAYWQPHDIRVARFITDTNRSDLSCYWPTYESNPSLGVRYVEHPNNIERILGINQQTEIKFN